VATDLSHARAEPVQVGLPGQDAVIQPPGAPALPGPAAQQRAVEAALRAQPGTLHYVAESDQLFGVAGLTGQHPITAFRGAAAWTGYPLIRGHWYTGPGQIVASTGFLSLTGKAVGDTATITLGGRVIPVRITGEDFDSDGRGVSVITDWRTLDAGGPGLAQPDQYDVGLRPGTTLAAYAQAIGGRLGASYGVSLNNRNSNVVTIMTGLIGTLTLLLALVAGLGVLNTVVLYTREQVHDLGMLKAIGMTPRQTITMVICWVAGTGLAAGLISVPAGVALHHYVLPVMASAANLGLPIRRWPGS
jgi:putative ABC transport system permease protein